MEAKQYATKQPMDQEKIKNYLETSENANTTAENLWDAVKAVLRGEFIVMQSYLGKQEKSQTAEPYT